MITQPYLAGLFCGVVLPLSLTPHLYAQNSSKIVLAHYMPWYESKPVSGHWGWHWTMDHFNPDKVKANGQREIASHDYPLMDPYDSNDPHALECHVLLMKFAGIDGAIVDWYGTEQFADHAKIHRNTQYLIKHLKRAGLQFAICYEDRPVKDMVEREHLSKQEDVAHGQKVMKWLADNWFGDEAYIKLNGRPVLLIFGPQYFTKDKLIKIMSDLSPPPMFYGLPHLSEKTVMDGVFGWVPAREGNDWCIYFDYLYTRDWTDGSVIPIVFPGYCDIYEEAGVHDSYGSIDYRDGETFAETLDLALKSNSPIVQIATWNDYGEGTVIEPTKTFGYRYLEFIQKNAKAQWPFGPDALRLPVILYQLKKRYERNSARMNELERATDLLFAGKCNEARSIIEGANKR